MIKIKIIKIINKFIKYKLLNNKDLGYIIN